MKELIGEYIDALQIFDRTLERLTLLKKAIELEASHGVQREAVTVNPPTFPGGFFSVDLKGRIMSVNRDAEEFLALFAFTIVSGMTIWECFQHNDILHNNFTRAMLGKIPIKFEFFIYNEKKWLEIDIYPHRDGLAVFVQDISVAKQHEAALYNANERFQVVFGRSPAMISIRTLGDWKYVDVNDTWLKGTGYGREDVIGRTEEELGMVVDPKQTELLKYANAPELRGGKMRTKTGAIRELLVATEVIELHGQLCALFISLDITELNQCDREIIRLDRLNLVGEIAASVGHEVRNPLTTIRGFLQLFSRKKEFVNYTQQLTVMVEEIDRANMIINDFLSLTKNEQVQLSLGDLNKVPRVLAPLLEATISGKGHALSLCLEELPELFFDEQNIRQLVLNLVYNGLEAMTNRGLITIKTYQEGNEVILSVQDTGHGLPQEILEKLGTPFMTTKEKGTGLGLAICFRIAERHKAKIQVTTNGNGTIVDIKFRLPNFLQRL